MSGPRPHRESAALIRDRPFATLPRSRRRKRPYVYFVHPRLVRLVSQPLAVGRERCLTVHELRFEKLLGHAPFQLPILPLHRNRPNLCTAGTAAHFYVRQTFAVSRKGPGKLWSACIHLRKALGLTGPV